MCALGHISLSKSAGQFRGHSCGRVVLDSYNALPRKDANPWASERVLDSELRYLLDVPPERTYTH